MEGLLQSAGFQILQIHDSTEASQAWFEAMALHQVRDLMERRIRTVTFIGQH